MDNYLAVGIAEGFEEADSEEQIIEAWQHLVDTGLAWQLQGWFGRAAQDLIERGIIHMKVEECARAHLAAPRARARTSNQGASPQARKVASK